MKIIKKAGVVMLAAVLLLSANIHPAVVHAEAQETVDTFLRSTVGYEVSRGDCLSILAERFGVKLSDLMAVNGLSEDSILKEGRRLVIPVPGIRYYTVKPGDTLWGLALKFGVTVEALQSVNNISEEDALRINEKLLIPVSDQVSTENEDDDLELGKYYLGLSNLAVWPVTGQVSSEFGPRWGRKHEGLDIATDEWEPIRALKSGTVVFAGHRGTYGKTIIINHGHGFRSLYAHASHLEVRPGEYVEQGQTIARVGNTGKSTGPHLHLEILYKGLPLNPEKCLPTEDWRI